MIGSLLYLTASCPDILFATSMYARFQAKPKASDLLVVKHIFRYLKHTPNLVLCYPWDSDFKLVGFSNSNYIGCCLDRKSTSSGCQVLGNRLISWSSKTQSFVECSTAKVKYVAAKLQQKEANTTPIKCCIRLYKGCIMDKATFTKGCIW